MPAPASTALIVVDMQNAFIAPATGAPVDGAKETLAAVNDWVAYADRRGWRIFYTRDVAPLELPDGDPDHQTELHPDLDVRGTVVPKGPGKDGGYSGFVLAAGSDPAGEPVRGTPGSGGLGPLAEQLRGARAEAVVVVGIAADVCVSATAMDARRLGYDVTMPLSAVAFVHAHPRGDDAAIADLRAAGVAIGQSNRVGFAHDPTD